MFEFLEDLFEGKEETEELKAANQEGIQQETSGSGFYIQNGILYNGNIDTMLTDLYQDMGENLEEQAKKKAELEASGEPYMDSAGIIHNASWEQDYQSLMSELPGTESKI